MTPCFPFPDLPMPRPTEAKDANGVFVAPLPLAEGLSGKVLRVDLSSAHDKSAVLTEMARALSFPDWFGFNWDALADCLTDFSWHPATARSLVFEGAEAFARSQPADFTVLADILADAAAYWAEDGQLFTVVFVPSP